MLHLRVVRGCELTKMRPTRSEAQDQKLYFTVGYVQRRAEGTGALPRS